MEKIININFQGRVIPIEENAYNSLKQYIDSLRTYFANEESSDEIINDIENRIAELLSERLKQGISCVTHTDVTAVINNIGRLEDIEAAEGEETIAPPKPKKPTQGAPAPDYRGGRLFRNADDKVIAGVCSGLAIRMGIDPVVLRVIFVILFGALFPIYLLLWIIVPSKSINTNVTRRLYRNPDDKVIAGVCGGLSVYFRTESWIMRLIFAAPLLLGGLFRGFHLFRWNSGFGPHILVGSFGSTLFLLYIILWIALPYASSSTDKLEMRGEKIDINSIKATTQANAGNMQRQRYSGFGRVIGILFKAFFLFIGGIIAVSLFGVLIGLFFAGTVAIPFTNFIFDGWEQYSLVWAGVVLFLGIPFLALLTWIIRRIAGVRSHRHYLGYVFAGLWVIGFISVLALAGVITHSFSAKSMIEEQYALHQPTANKLYINVNNGAIPGISARHSRWYGGDWDNNNNMFHLVNNDSIWLNTVKVNVVKSDDSLFHVYETRISRGTSPEDAKRLAGHVTFTIDQQDSVLNLPAGFTISNKDKFRNQQVMVTVEVPMGKTIQFDDHVSDYNWFTINGNGHRNYGVEYISDDDDNDYRSNSVYTMTPAGLKNPSDSLEDKNKDDDDNDDVRN